MAKWITLLRIFGALLFIGIIVALIHVLTALPGSISISTLLSFLQPIAISLLCFGMAAGLSSLQKLSERIERASIRRRTKSERQDLAPTAPNWSSPLESPRQEVTPGFSPQRRVDRYAIGTPMVREAPRAIRTTPGTEDQYGDDPLIQRAAYLAKPEPSPTRYMLNLARDAQIRRKQSGKN